MYVFLLKLVPEMPCSSYHELTLKSHCSALSVLDAHVARADVSLLECNLVDALASLRSRWSFTSLIHSQLLNVLYCLNVD